MISVDMLVISLNGKVLSTWVKLPYFCERFIVLIVYIAYCSTHICRLTVNTYKQKQKPSS